MSATATATATTLPALVFSSESSSSASSSDEAYSGIPLVLPPSKHSVGSHSITGASSDLQHSNTLVEMHLGDDPFPSNVDVISQRPHKLRKSTRPPPTSYRSTPSFMPHQGSNPNLYLSPLASSSQIARTTAIVQDKLSMGAGSSSEHTRISSKTSSSYVSSNSSSSHSLSRSTSMISPPPSTRKLAKRRPHQRDSPPPVPTKSKSMRRNFKLASHSLTKNPARVSLYSDSLPPLLSTSPIPWNSQELRALTSSPPAIAPLPKVSPLDLGELYFDAREFGSDNGAEEPSSPAASEPKRGPGASLMRRWSLLEVPDEVLAVELEEMRRVNRIKERRRSNRAQSENHGHSGFQAQEVPRPYSPNAFVYGGPSSGHRFWLGDDDASDDDGSDVGSDDGWLEEDSGILEEDEEDWKRTRRALFCCRELIRTEKSYSVRLVQLLDGKTLTPPPTLLMSYLPALIMASNTLLDNFAQDPTAYGVSKAFIDAESMLENGLVPYCGVVGDVFMNRSEKRKLVRTPRRNSLIDVHNKVRNGLVEGGTGERMRDSRFVIKEELLKPPLHLPEVHRNTAPPVMESSKNSSVVDIGLEYDSRSPSEVPMKRGALRRTMSLFKRGGGEKRKSLPPLPSQTDLRVPRSTTPNPRSSPSMFYSGTVARASSLISLAFGLTPGPPPAPPPKPPPPPLPPKDVRAHTQSAPTPPSMATIDLGTYEFPTGPTSNTSHVGSSSTHGHGYGVVSSSGHDERPEKIPTVRDLAIQPTQRAMRYVLLYRDLLDQTPLNSPTRPLVESALEGAIRIADKCDRAQGNAAFLRRA